MITAEMVKNLREVTGAGILECKKALTECNGDMEASIDWLREKGILKAAKKAERIAAEGLAQIAVEGNYAAIVEVNSETDFVAKNEEFKELVNAFANTIAKNNPTTEEDVLALEYNGTTLGEYLTEKTAKIGEKLSFRRFVKLENEANEVFGAYLHMGGKIAALVQLTGANEDVAKDVAMHLAAMRPRYLRREDVPADVTERERNVIKEQTMNEGKSEEIALKMVEGRLNKFYKEICLEEQPFIKDDKSSVLDYVKKNGGSIKAIVRFEVGEGMAKKEENFAEEVMNQIKG